MFYLKIGFRNMLKNKKRSVLTMTTVIIGMAALILSSGFINYSLWGLRESIINGGIGHIQIYKKGFVRYGDEKPYEYLITGYKKIIRDLMRIPGISVVAPRLRFQGIVASADKTTIVMGTAGLIDEEKQLTTFNELKSGKQLSDEDPNGILIGSGVARSISAQAGDQCTVMVTMEGGSVNAIDFNITGIIRGQLEELDNVYALANLGTIQQLLNVSNSIDTLVLKFTQTENMAKIEPQVKEYCEKKGLEYRRWDQIAPYYEGAREFYQSAMNVAMIVIFAIVIFAVANTMTMSLFERVREIGTIRSLGTTRDKVIKIFMSESLLLGIFGGIAGIILGVLIAQTVNSLGGIPIPPPPGNARGYQAMIKPDAVSSLLYLALFTGVSIVAVIFPAVKASRMSITDALRYI